VQKILWRFEREGQAERKRMQQGHTEWLVRNEQAQLDTSAYAVGVDRLKATLDEIDADARLTINDQSSDVAAVESRIAAREPRIILATRQYRDDLKAAVDHSIAYVTRRRQEAQRRQEKHNLALELFDQQYAAHVAGLEAEIDRLNVEIAASAWEWNQYSGGHENAGEPGTR
jgi:hypothetical protein